MQTCNIFAAEESCVSVPPETELGQACAAARPELKVDCVYSERALMDSHINPVDGMAAVMGSDYAPLRQHCPQCLENLQAFVRSPGPLRWLAHVPCELVSCDHIPSL